MVRYTKIIKNEKSGEFSLNWINHVFFTTLCEIQNILEKDDIYRICCNVILKQIVLPAA